MRCPDLFPPNDFDKLRNRTAHASTLAAVAAESRSGHVAIETNCVGKAQVMLASLREHRLIDL